MRSNTPAGIDSIIEQDADQLVETVAESVRIPSVLGPAKPGKPFGAEVDRALEHALGVAERFGFEVGRLEGYAGWVDLGSGDELIGVLSHVDVVPAGKTSDWNHPPFGAEIVDGVMVGRGTADDKGPLFSVLYGMKAIRDARLPLTKRMRLLLGTNEESGWGGIRRYLETEELPARGFSPDGMFTVVNREKGISVLRLVGTDRTRAAEGMRLGSVHGGTAPNSVPDEAIARIEGASSLMPRIQQAMDEAMKQRSSASFSLDVQDEGGVHIRSTGRAAHAMNPEQGSNAIAELLHLLRALDLVEDGATRFVALLDEHIGFDTTGTSLGMGWRDDPSGALTLNLGQIEIDRGEAVAVLDIRSPVSIACQEVIDQVGKVFENGSDSLRVEIQKQNEPLYVPEEHPLIKTLTAVYERVTGRESVLHAIGGGTYARAIDNCVCFGAVYPDEEITVHRPNERASIEKMIQNAKVYGHALYELAQ